MIPPFGKTISFGQLECYLIRSYHVLLTLNGSDSVKQVSSKKLMSCFYTYSSFEESNFLYLKTSKKEKLYVTIAQEEAVKVLHNYFFGQSKNPSNTLKYYKHSLIRALDTIVHNDMFDSLKEKYPQAFVSHKNTEDLEKYLSLVFQLKSTHARNIVRKALCLSSFI